MASDHRERLKSIRTFPSLVKYLREELDWPIGADNFEDMTFDYSPEELGIDTKIAAKIQEIRRLRPLSANQPWGIFFIKFEPKRLPVVALRRILSQVALKKRASANSAERAAWKTDDLLFVSNYGEGENRQISFAHFSENIEKKGLPTLKVLGWDNLDTALHLDHVADELQSKLAWPDDTSDTELWRSRWRSAFTLKHREIINTSKKLSIELAKLARNIRDRINTVLEIETKKGPVSKLMAAFKEALVHDLDDDGFADMYAQTIAYGLLSARVANPSGSTAEDFAAAMPVTNPFLKELMETFLNAGGRKGQASSGVGLDFDELGVTDIVDLLNAPETQMDAVLRDFGDRNPQEDPVIHFFEGFLQEYDNKIRKDRGVFYTPRPVVSFIVRSVDELLRTEFELEDGLADTTSWGEMAERLDDLEVPEGVRSDQTFVQILDPATGTGTFLVEVIGLVHKTMTEKWHTEGHSSTKIMELWNDYVPKSLLPRLHGYELMMAPYAIAHMKLSLKLYETGYRFGSDERARIYLTNSLEPPQEFSDTFAFAIPALAHEAQEVNSIKRNRRFTVVIGNPPYSGEGMNKGEWIRSLIDTYMYVDGSHLGEKGKKNWLQDDYVKFIRYAQHVLNQSKTGILGFINNHSFLDNPTFRGMRASLMASFPKINIIDLHGNSKKKERCPDGTNDENVFDIIQQGVSIGLFRRNPVKNASFNIEHAHLWGLRGNASTAGKLRWLADNSIASTDWTHLYPISPFYLFVPQNLELRAEYASFWKLTDVMPHYGAGIITSRDHFVIDFDDAPLRDRLDIFRDPSISDDSIRANLGIRDNSMWSMAKARDAFRENPIRDDLFVDILYRPFDRRRIYFETNVVFNMRLQIMRHMLAGENLGLLTARSNKSPTKDHFFCSKLIVETKCGESTTQSSFFPLYLYPPDEEGLSVSMEAHPNFSPSFLAALRDSLKTDIDDPRAIFHYAYGVFHSPTYRSRFDEFLKTDFPQLPITGSLELFRSLALLGGQLVSLHIMESPLLDSQITTFVGSDDFQVEKVSYSEETAWIDKAKTLGFQGVPEEVWNFHIGGYQVCNKWLKDRQAKGGKNPRPARTLTDDDIDHYQKIVVALNETIRIVAEIDEAIEAHGGWPDAFQVDQASNRSTSI